MSKEWVVVIGQVVTGRDGFEVNYSCDGERFPTRAKAIKYGFAIRGSDDFNVASLDGDRMTGFYWMGKQFAQDECESVAAQLGMS